MDIKRVNSIDKKVKKESLLKDNHICIASKFGISCNESAVGSHSYWRKGIVDHLAIENKVITLAFDETELINTRTNKNFYKKISAKSANTFGGFCRSHDDEIFKLIEKNNCNPPYSIEQQFLFMVRALSYQFVHEKDSREWINNSLKKPYPKQIMSDSEWKNIESNFKIVKNYTEDKDNILAKLEPWFDRAKLCFVQEGIKVSFNTDNINRLFCFKSYKINGKLDFAALGIYIPELVHDISEKNDIAIFNVIPHRTGGHLLMCYLPNSFVEKNIIPEIEYYYRADAIGSYLKAIVENLVLEHTENIILSPRISEERLNVIEQRFKESSMAALYLRNRNISMETRRKIAESMTLFKAGKWALFEL